MTTTEIQARIEQVRKNLTTNKTKLDSLRTQRGQLSIENSQKHAATIKRLDGQIEDVRKDVENCPVEIRLLEEQLTTAQAEEAQAAMDVLIEQQKSCAGQMEAISKKLVKALEIAHDLNLQLTTVTSRYATLQKQTLQDVIVKPTCRPSEQLLQVVYETLRGELEGNPKNVRCQGQPPFVRI